MECKFNYLCLFTYGGRFTAWIYNTFISTAPIIIMYYKKRQANYSTFLLSPVHVKSHPSPIPLANVSTSKYSTIWLYGVLRGFFLWGINVVYEWIMGACMVNYHISGNLSGLQTK